MYTITLSDGTTLNNIELNGSTFIAPRRYTAADFEGKLSTVTFSDGEETYTLHDCALFLCHQSGNKTWIVIDEKTEKMKQDELNTELELALTELYEMIIGG